MFDMNVHFFGNLVLLVWGIFFFFFFSPGKATEDYAILPVRMAILHQSGPTRPPRTDFTRPVEVAGWGRGKTFAPIIGVGR